MTGGGESSRLASRRGAILVAAVLALGSAGIVACRASRRGDAGDDVRRLVLAQADSLDSSLVQLRRAFADRPARLAQRGTGAGGA